ncbi:MAG: RidA family protein [Lachnospiraceae bacterium]|nr:RidA family protein [Lachnospiraceae bacterium]
MKTEISTKNAPTAIGPYSQAIEANGMVYTSGMIPIDPQTGELVTGSVEQQAEQVFSNLRALIEASGSSMDKVVKTVVFIKNMDDFGAINAIYEKYFTEPYPARSCVEVARLPKDVALEAEAVALK